MGHEFNEHQLDLEVRLLAIEAVLVQIGKIAMVTAGMSPEHAEQMRENGYNAFVKETFPAMEPAQADHLSASLAERVEMLLQRISHQVADAYESARLQGL